MKRWIGTYLFLQKPLTTALSLLVPAANMLGTRLFLIGCMIWHHSVFFGVDLRNQHDHNFPFRLTDVTLHSSCDLLSSSLLPFTWTICTKSNPLAPFFSLGQNYSKSKSSSLISPIKIFLRQNFLFSLPFLNQKF